ncbi:MAG: VCBS domain-containing protein, partial [Rhodoluna sp.]
TEGVGEPASVTGTLSYASASPYAPVDTRVYTLAGKYGTVVVSANGAYTYTLDQNNADVQALAAGQTLTETFNYTLSDGRPAYLTDSATLTFTVNGANDKPTLSGISSLASTVKEDVASFINTGGLTFVDPDMGAVNVRVNGVNQNFKVYFSAPVGRLVIPVLPDNATGISVKGSDTGKLTLIGSMAAINEWLSQDRIQYVTAPNAEGTATVSVSADDGYGVEFLGSATLTIAPQNDSPLMDLNGLAGQPGGAPGYGFTALFRPRGDAVLIADSDAAITDADTGDTIQSAVIRITKGAVDNEFGTIYETLTSALGATYTSGAHSFTITGNGTPEITVSGQGTHAEYQTIVRSISYINANPNAYGGNREITVRLIDTADAPANRVDSNLSMVTLATANTAVAVGQKIIIDGVDSGATVAAILDSQNFVASRQISSLATTSTLKFATSAVVNSVTNGTSFVLEAGNTSVAVGDSIVSGGATVATVSSVSTSSGVTTVTTTAAHGLSVGAELSFETSALNTQVATSAVRHVSSSVNSGTALQLSAIDLTIEVGQRIYLGGSDTGKTVSAVAHNSSGTLVTASGALTATTANDLTFVTFATNILPTAIATIQNVWTTEVDLNGVLETGRDYTTSFKEGQTGGTNIASASASLDNQEVHVKSVVVTLTNPVDGASGAAEALSLNPAYTVPLLGRGITST